MIQSIGAIGVAQFRQQIDDLLPQDGKIALNDVLQNVRVKQVVGVGKDVSCSDDSSPWDLRVGQPILIAELPCCFANDFKIAAHCIEDHWFFRPIPAKAGRISQSFIHTVLDMDEIEPMVFHRKLQRPGFGQYTITDDGMKAPAFDKINRSIEQIPQVRKQFTEIEYVSAGFEVNKKIDIAIRSGLASRNRAKDTHICCTVETGQMEYRRSLFGLKNVKCQWCLFLLCNSHAGIRSKPKSSRWAFSASITRTREISIKPAMDIAEAARAWGQNDDITVVTVRSLG